MTPSDPGRSNGSPVPALTGASVCSVQIGTVRRLQVGSGSTPSGFVKTPTDAAVHLTYHGLVGDEQGDRRVHGGPEKAVCVYPVEHYPYWSLRLGRPLPPGAFAENLTTRGLLETDLRLGDVLAVGSTLVQISQPRRTCAKLAAHHGWPSLAAEVQESGRTGFYLRVLTCGALRAGQPLELVQPGPGRASLAEVNRVMNVDRHDVAGIHTLLDEPALPPRWRATLEGRLRGRFSDERVRLYGLGTDAQELGADQPGDSG